MTIDDGVHRPTARIARALPAVLVPVVLLLGHPGAAHADTVPEPQALTIIVTSGLPNHLAPQKVVLDSVHRPIHTVRGGAALFAGFLHDSSVPPDRRVVLDTGSITESQQPLKAIANVLQAVGYDAVAIDGLLVQPNLLVDGRLSTAGAGGAVALQRKAWPS